MSNIARITKIIYFRSYNNYYRRLRVKAVQEFDRMYHESEYKAKCHKRVWKRLGCYIFGISYQSYLDSLLSRKSGQVGL